MGLLNDDDWKAEWLSAPGAEKFALTPFGFRAITSETQSIKWVQVDLEKSVLISAVRLTPMFFEDRAGYGFPQGFKIEVSDDSKFERATIVADYTTTSFTNPGWKPVSFSVNNATARYVR